jgi:hypothetical protein
MMRVFPARKEERHVAGGRNAVNLNNRMGRSRLHRWAGVGWRAGGAPFLGFLEDEPQRRTLVSPTLHNPRCFKKMCCQIDIGEMVARVILIYKFSRKSAASIALGANE